MYKSKLQEMCQKKRWGLPKYWATKQGPDHMSSFQGHVSVHGLTFTSQRSFSTTEEAQNQAAMLAFQSFSSSPPGSSIPKSGFDTMEQIEAAKPKDIAIPAQSPVVIDGMDHLSKSQLNCYAQKNKLNPPIYYTSKSEGPSHDPRFKATVQVGGQSFESLAFFNTIKGAEQAAAKVALMSSSLGKSDKCDYGPFKTLLLELTQRKGFCKPVYDTTIQYESVHGPTFFTSVKVEDKEFHGKARKSMKDAEEDVSWIAYIALKDCRELNEISPATVKVRSEDCNPSFQQHPKEDMKKNNKRKYSNFSSK